MNCITKKSSDKDCKETSLEQENTKHSTKTWLHDMVSLGQSGKREWKFQKDVSIAETMHINAISNTDSYLRRYGNLAGIN